MYIYPPETAAGAVNGVNKTFTLENNIFQIGYIIVDGVIYGGNVTFISGTDTFLLEDAPVSLSPQVAYYDSAPSLPTGTHMTVAEARAEFLKRKKDISDIDAIAGTFLQWCNYINRFAYRELSNIQPEEYVSTQTYSWTPGVASYPVPSDFLNINPQGTGLYLVSQSGVNTDSRLPITGFGSSKTGFYMNSSSFTLTPIPTEAKPYILRYIPQLADLTEETDQLIIPNRFSYHIMDVLDACYNVWDEDQGAEVFNDERVIRTMNELVSNIKPDGQVANLSDFSEAYYY